MTPGIAWSIIDFEAVGTTGDIAEYIWSFWDNTQSERWYTTPHIFEKAGTYTIWLTIIYKDGTRDTLNKEYTIIKDS
jgi:PKD repeat protein